MTAGVSSRVFELPPDEVHVWHLFSDGVTDPHLLDRYAALMNAEERARHQRFAFAKDRHQFLVTRGFIRTLIARYVGVPPADCVFVSNHYGRPSLQSGRTDARVEFSLSHTPHLIACAITRGREVGIDVEDLDRMAVNPDLPRHYFSPAEVAALDATPPAERPSRFFEYWTLKEAYIKARGMGLSLPLDGFSIHLEGHRPPRITFAPSIADDPSSWQFAQFDPGPRHRLALAVRRQGPDLTIRIRPFNVVVPAR